MKKLSKIEEMLKEIFGYADWQLEDEMRQAEDALEKEGRIEVTEKEYEALMERINKRRND